MDNQNQTLEQTEILNRPIVTAMFADRDDAEMAYMSLLNKGYTKDEVNLVMSEDTKKTHFANEVNKTELGNKAMEGAGKGSAIGGTIGAIAGAIAAIGTSLLIPGLGLVVAGPLAAALAGAGAGGLTGGIIGALAGAGIPKERAEVYEKGIKSGHIVLIVHARNPDDASFFEKDFRKFNAQEINR